ncbi:MAG: ABC transporter ATP-binding protein [Christensenellales bacterium]|jgi:ABC-type uncharacterized transport system ATPase subunit
MAYLEMRGITKGFQGVLANDKIDFCLEEGEIHALLGENGAGKTTLMNILYGLYQPDGGDIFLRGEKVNIQNPKDAINLGIGMVHQHFMLVSKMTMLQNIVLGLRPYGSPFFNKAKLRQDLEALCERYGLGVELDVPVNRLSVGIQQRGEIIKALYREAKLLVLDEPTAVLTPQEILEFFDIMRALKAKGCSIILISHKLQEILDVADRATVLRDGKAITTVKTKETNEVALSNAMIGRMLQEGSAHRETFAHDQPALSVSGLGLQEKEDLPVFKDISFDLYQGEVLGIAGVDGNGQLELAEALTGIRKHSQGDIVFRGQSISQLSIRKRFELGMAYVPSDRHRDGLIMDADVKSNIALRGYYKAPMSKRGILAANYIEETSERLVQDYHVKTAGIGQQSRLLSGGNQQKVILGREINSDPSVIIAAQPTRGLDIGATEQMRNLLMNFRNQGKSVLLISTDLDELLQMSDRILVMYKGCVAGVLKNDETLDLDTLGLLMGGYTCEVVADEQ